MTARERTVGALAGSLAGLAGGLFGVGGGIVLVPLLTGPLGYTQHQAHGTSLAVIGVTAIVSIAIYAFHGNVAWGSAALIGPASFFAARYGARLAARTPSRWLARSFAIFLVVVAIRLLFFTHGAAAAPIPQGPPRWIFDLALGGLAGVLAGYMGVGGGVLIVPALTIFTGMSQQLAQGTSLAVILLAAPGGAIEHHRKGNLVLPLVPWLALGAALGAPLAALAAQWLPQQILGKCFALFLLTNGILGWIRSRPGARSGPDRD